MILSRLHFILTLPGLLCFAFLLAGCDHLFPPPPDSQTPIHPGSDAPPLTGAPADLTGGRGVVKCTGQWPANYFNAQVKQFLSTTRDSSGLGFVGCSKEHLQTHKIYFHIKGSVPFENGGKLSLSDLTVNLQVSKQAQLQIFIKPQTQQEIGITLPAGAFPGEVRGNVALLTFEDQKGRVVLDGEIRTNKNGISVFSAPFRYENYTLYNRTDSGGYKGVIGMAEIPACQFFDCG